MAGTGIPGTIGSGAGGAGASGGGGALGPLGGIFSGTSLTAIAGGVVAGVLGGGALLAAGAVSFGPPVSSPPPPIVDAAARVVVPCPDTDVVLESVAGGQAMLVTGRSSDGGWLQVYLPAPGIGRGWIRASQVSLKGDPGTLPVVDCAQPAVPSVAPSEPPSPTLVAIVSPSPEPSVEPSSAAPSESPTSGPSLGVFSTLSAAPSQTPRPTPSPPTVSRPTPQPTRGANPTRRPTPTPTPAVTPSPTPTPTTPVANVAPTLKSLENRLGTISTGDPRYCPSDPRETTVSVSATDADGLGSVTLFYRPAGATAFRSKPMSRGAGSAWSTTINTDRDGLSAAGSVPYFVTAIDANALPKSSRLPTSGTQAFTVKRCVNTGPVISHLSADSTTVAINPTGQGSCSDALGTGITARAVDAVDGVQSVTLHFTGPGLSGTAARTMTSNPPDYNGFIHPTDDGITGTGTITWWVEAVDGAGLSTESDKQSITVIRCDADAAITATVSGLVEGSLYFNCSTPPQLVWAIDIRDPDAAALRLKVDFSWQLSNSAATLSGTANPTFDGQLWRVTLTATTLNSWNRPEFYSPSRLSWTVTSTDPFGGRSTKSFSTTMQDNSCLSLQAPPQPVLLAVDRDAPTLAGRRRRVRLRQHRRAPRGGPS